MLVYVLTYYVVSGREGRVGPRLETCNIKLLKKKQRMFANKEESVSFWREE
jgi:hypothetical protein